MTDTAWYAVAPEQGNMHATSNGIESGTFIANLASGTST